MLIDYDSFVSITGAVLHFYSVTISALASLWPRPLFRPHARHEKQQMELMHGWLPLSPYSWSKEQSGKQKQKQHPGSCWNSDFFQQFYRFYNLPFIDSARSLVLSICLWHLQRKIHPIFYATEPNLRDRQTGLDRRGQQHVPLPVLLSSSPALCPQGRGRRRSLLTRQVFQLQDGGVGDPVIKRRVGVPTPRPAPRSETWGRLVMTTSFGEAPSYP